ncbi:unnamed protein product, partial [Effrenium voratum]
ELSIAEGARSARDSVDDGPTCELMGMIASWGSTPGSEERSFSRIAIASLVIDTIEEHLGHGKTLPGIADELSKAFEHYKKFCKRNKMPACSFRFSLAKFNRKQYTNLPVLASCYKANVVKGMVYWVADYLNTFKDSQLDKQRACCGYALARFQSICDRSPEWFSDEARREASTQIRNFLQLYQSLAAQ